MLLLAGLPKGPIGAITARGLATDVTFVKTMMMIIIMVMVMMMMRSIMMVMNCRKWKADLVIN